MSSLRLPSYYLVQNTSAGLGWKRPIPKRTPGLCHSNTSDISSTRDLKTRRKVCAVVSSLRSSANWRPQNLALLVLQYCAGLRGSCDRWFAARHPIPQPMTPTLRKPSWIWHPLGTMACDFSSRLGLTLSGPYRRLFVETTRKPSISHLDSLASHLDPFFYSACYSSDTSQQVLVEAIRKRRGDLLELCNQHLDTAELAQLGLPGLTPLDANIYLAYEMLVEKGIPQENIGYHRMVQLHGWSSLFCLRQTTATTEG